MVLTLYKLDASPPARAVMMTLEALGIRDVEMVDVNLFEGAQFTEEYVKMNPQHTIPALKDDDFAIWDSHAICPYLVSKYGQDDSLYPQDPQRRAVIDQRLHFDSGILFPSLRATVAPVLFLGERSFKPEGLQAIKAGYDFLEKFLDKPYCAGDQLSIADICTSATVSSMSAALPIDADTYPNIKAWLDRLSKEEFYTKVNLPGLQQFSGALKSKLL